MRSHDPREKTTLCSLLLIIPSYGLLVYGCWKESLGMILTGAILLILGVLMASSGRLLAEVLVRKIGQLSKVGPKGAEFSEKEAIVIGGPAAESDVDEASISVDLAGVLKNIRSELGVTEDQAKEIVDKVLSVLREGIVLEEAEDDES